MLCEASKFRFVERAIYEQGFSNVFTTKIAPALQELERERQAINNRTGKWIEIILAVTVTLSVAATIYVHVALALFPLFWGCGVQNQLNKIEYLQFAYLGISLFRKYENAYFQYHSA